MRHLTIALALLLSVSAAELAATDLPTVKVINPIEVPSGMGAEALAIWDAYADVFRKQPGYIGTQLHRSVDPNAKFLFINVAEWRSAEDFLRALDSDEIKAIGQGFPAEMPHYPSVYEIIRD